MDILGERLNKLRIERDLSMDLLVADLKEQYSMRINKSMLSRWENGQNTPSLENAKCLCQYFNVSLDYLIGLTDIRTPSRLLANRMKARDKDN